MASMSSRLLGQTVGGADVSRVRRNQTDRTWAPWDERGRFGARIGGETAGTEKGSDTKPQVMDFSVRFEEARLRAGLSQSAVARPQYTVSYVSQIEAGRRTPSRDALDFFASRLGVSAD